MEPTKITGTVESDPMWSDRGICKLKLVEYPKPIWVKELQKHLLRKGLKQGDQFAAAVTEGEHYYFLVSVEGERAASSVPQTGSTVASIASEAPPVERPPETSDCNIPYSAKRIGQLYSILVDPEGNIIDGLHRHNVDPSWRKEVVPWVRSRKDFLVARIHANLHRRTVPKEERQQDFTELALILQNEGSAVGKLAAKIAEITGFNEEYVRRLLPSKLKLEEKRKWGRSGAEARSANLKLAQGVTQPETLPDAKTTLQEEAEKRALAVDSAAPQDYSNLYIGPCPACGARIRWDQELKIFARAAD